MDVHVASCVSCVVCALGDRSPSGLDRLASPRRASERENGAREQETSEGSTAWMGGSRRLRAKEVARQIGLRSDRSRAPPGTRRRWSSSLLSWPAGLLAKEDGLLGGKGRSDFFFKSPWRRQHRTSVYQRAPAHGRPSTSDPIRDDRRCKRRRGTDCGSIIVARVSDVRRHPTANECAC